eukprot:Awhi_evm1s3598
MISALLVTLFPFAAAISLVAPFPMIHRTKDHLIAILVVLGVCVVKLCTNIVLTGSDGEPFTMFS